VCSAFRRFACAHSGGSPRCRACLPRPSGPPQSMQTNRTSERTSSCPRHRLCLTLLQLEQISRLRSDIRHSCSPHPPGNFRDQHPWTDGHGFEPLDQHPWTDDHAHAMRPRAHTVRPERAPGSIGLQRDAFMTVGSPSPLPVPLSSFCAYVRVRATGVRLRATGGFRQSQRQASIVRAQPPCDGLCMPATRLTSCGGDAPLPRRTLPGSAAWPAPPP
jgi:hypothetical protein